MSDHVQMWEELGLDVELHEKVLASIGASYETIIASQKNRPEGMQYFDTVIHESHGGRVREILDAKSEGRKMLGTFCIYVPDEIAMAASAIPVALCGGTSFSIPYAETMFPRDICPLVKSTLGLSFSKTCPYGPIKDMAVGETTCDAKKKTWDILAQKINFHVLEIPQKKTDMGRELWLSEVRAFRHRVEELTGNAIEREALADAIKLMNRKRRLLADMNEFRKAPRPPISGRDALVVMQGALNDDPARICDRLEMLNAELADRLERGVSPFPDDAVRVLVAGCPSVMGNWKIHHIIESSGGMVVCDESCTGSRYFTHYVDENGSTVDEQLAALADRYFKIDCSCFTPNTERVENVVGLATEYGADAVIQYILQYCHTYNIEAIRVNGALEKAGIPSITIESDYGEEDEGQLRTRVEALLESVRC